MARAPKTSAPAESKSTALTNWDEEMAKYAEQAAAQEANSGGGQFFSMRSGILSFNDAPLPNNEMAVIILDHIFETTYYEGDYDPDNPASPSAFSFGRNEEEMTWHASSIPEYAGKPVKGSDICEWGSADKGKGKAAKETRRLAMIPAGTIGRDGRFTPFEDTEHFQTAAIGYMKLPVTSVKGFASFVKSVAGALKRPPFGIFTKVKVVPDPKTQFKVIFEPIAAVPNSLMPAIFPRHEEAMTLIDFPYVPREQEEEKSAPVAKGRGAAKPAARGRKY